MSHPTPEANEPDKGNLARFNPATWSKKTKIIAASAALALVLAGTGTGFAYHQYTIDRDCQAQTELFSNQKTEFTKAVKDAEDALALVEGDKPAAHTKGFTETTSTDTDATQNDASQNADSAQDDASASTSVDGKTLTADLKKAIDTAKKHIKDAAPKQCSTGDDLDAIEALTSSRQADLDALTAQTKDFSAAVDAYRLKTASAEATSSMKKAKSDLAAAQKAATEQLAVVDADIALQSDATVKTAYDVLKKTQNDSHSVSTTVTTSTYEEAVESIKKAKAVAAKTDEVKAATQKLKDAIKAYNDAKAAEKAAAQAAAQATRAQQYSSPRSGGSTRTQTPAPASTHSAPAPKPAESVGVPGMLGWDELRVRCGENFERCQ